MGEKGAELTNDSSQAAEDIQSRLTGLGNIRTKKMFGGYGVFEDDKMFALIDSGGQVFFKVDDTNLASYVEAGSEKHSRMPYYQVPDDVFGDDELLEEWAASSIKISKSGK